MRRSLGTVLDLRISPSSQREISGREECGGSTELIVKSVLESEGRGCQVAARAMYEERKGRGRGGLRRTFRRMENLSVFY
jgi:hypothetical protein